jgi:hypothetical protein
MPREQLMNRREFKLSELPVEEKVKRFDLMIEEMEITLEETPRMAEQMGDSAGINYVGGFRRLVRIAKGLSTGRPKG